MSDPETVGNTLRVVPEVRKPKEANTQGRIWLKALGYFDHYNDKGEWLGDIKLFFPERDGQPKRPILHPETRVQLTAEEFDVACPTDAAVSFKVLEKTPPESRRYQKTLADAQERFQYFCPIPEGYTHQPPQPPPIQPLAA